MINWPKYKTCDGPMGVVWNAAIDACKKAFEESIAMHQDTTDWNAGGRLAQEYLNRHNGKELSPLPNISEVYGKWLAETRNGYLLDFFKYLNDNYGTKQANVLEKEMTVGELVELPEKMYECLDSHEIHPITMKKFIAKGYNQCLKEISALKVKVPVGLALDEDAI